MPAARLRVVADDLSGAAECAAVLAAATGRPARLVLRGALPAAGSWVVDTDSRALPPQAAAAAAASALRQAASDPRALVFKKIDSTLRGHVAAELAAALAVPGLARAAVVCPALPSQGRSLLDGRVHVHGELRRDTHGRPVDARRLLAGIDGDGALLLQPARATSAAELADRIAAAVHGGSRVVVVDAAQEADLARLAQALLLAQGAGRLLAVGAAGLARALVASSFDAGAPPGGCGTGASAGPLVAVVGSFAPVATRQVDELAASGDVHLVRLPARAWLHEGPVVARAIAGCRAAGGHAIVLAAGGAAPAQSSRELVQQIAAAGEPLLRAAATLVLTGGDTARTVLERLGIAALDVLGEFEPGICVSRAPAGSPLVVTKSGGFGDDGALVRVLRHFAGGAAPTQAPASATTRSTSPP